MKAAVLIAPNNIEVQELHIPKLKKDEVLIKMDYAPINPSDLAFISGNYGIKKEYPVVPGIEGSGVVISCGGSLLTRILKNKRVACAAPANGNGTWAEYMVAKAKNCVVLKKNISQKQGSMFFVNPLTAIEFLKIAKKGGYDAVLMSAGGSALAQMVKELMLKNDIPFLGILRRENQQFKGINYLNSSDNFFEEHFLAWTKEYKKVLFLDAIGGGKVPYQILGLLPEGSKMYGYGRLSKEPAELKPEELLFKNLSIEGFWLNNKIKKKSLFQLLSDSRKVNRFLNSGYEIKIEKEVNLDELLTTLKKPDSIGKSGKVLIKF